MMQAKKILVLLFIFVTLLPNNNGFFIYFTYIKCLFRSTYFLSLLDKQNYCYKPCNCAQQEHCVQLDTAFFFHHKITTCIQKMIYTTSLKPMLQLYRDIKNHSYLDDDQFVRELFLLIFTIHKQILLDQCKDKPQALKTTTLNTILEISDKINQLPIAEILNAIDMLITELPPFLEKYEFHSKITWKEWLKKYWWVPPVFGGWFTLKILLKLQRPYYYFSPYLSPRPPIPLQPITTNDPVLAEIIVEPSYRKKTNKET